MINVDFGTSQGEASAAKPNRLARLATQVSLRHPKAVTLNLKNQDTLALALPQLLANATEEAERIIAEDDQKKGTK